jgi:hypothetical protein
MNFTSLIAGIAAWGLLLGTYRWLCRFSQLSANDVLAFLHKIDLEVLWGAFHPEAEETKRRELSPAAFKEFQWKRFHLAIFFCGLLADNSRVLQGWTRYERKRGWKNFPPALRRTITELRSACMQCRLGAFVITLRLRWWVLRMVILPWLPPPSFKTLLAVGSADMIGFYDKIRAMAEVFSLAYGEEYRDKLMAVL